LTYSSASDVAIYCPEMTDSGTTFTATTLPSLTQVNALIDRAYSRVNSRLAANGYSVPVTAGTTTYDELTDIEALYAAARAQGSRISSRIGPNERSKSDVLLEQHDKALKALLKRDLSRAGVTHTGKAYAGGISVDDKQAQEDDTDRVEPRFKTDQFRNADSQLPRGTGQSEET